MTAESRISLTGISVKFDANRSNGGSAGNGGGGTCSARPMMPAIVPRVPRCSNLALELQSSSPVRCDVA